jgi:hypothetical protein
MFGGRVFQQTIGTPIGTSCGPILAESVVFADMTWLVVTKIRVTNYSKGSIKPGK